MNATISLPRRAGVKRSSMFVGQNSCEASLRLCLHQSLGSPKDPLPSRYAPLLAKSSLKWLRDSKESGRRQHQAMSDLRGISAVSEHASSSCAFWRDSHYAFRDNWHRVTATLFGWLHAGIPDDSSAKYTLVSIESTTALDPAALEFVKQALQDARINPRFVEKAKARLSKSKYKKLLASADPMRANTRKGDFGEIVAAESLAQIFGYHIPIEKLRYKSRRADQPTGVDVVAFRLTDAGRIAEVCYTESKLRTVVDKAYGVAAHSQLKTTWEVAASDLHVYIGNILEERGDPLLESFLEYLEGDGDIGECFCLALHADSGKWDDATLKALNDLPPTLSPLSVHLFKMHDLNNAIKLSFEAIGVEVTDDTDD
jgi:hypothetical protein